MLDPTWTVILAISLGVYMTILLAIGGWASKKGGDSAEEFLLAGRSLPIPMAVITLLATWFGAGVMLSVTDEVAKSGISVATMDPIGVALCLFLAGWWLARPLWNMGILTVCDFYRRRFDVVTEKLAAVILVPSYFGWIALQFMAIAKLLEMFFGLSVEWGVFLAMAAGTGYTMLGGLRAVVWTDFFQLGFVLIGIVWLALLTFFEVGWEQTQTAMRNSLAFQPDLKEVALLLDLLVIGCLGNLPAQDLIQRFLCVRSASAASRACYWASVGYLLFGLFPIFMGLLSAYVLPESQTQVVMGIAGKLMSGPVLVIFVLAVISAVLSTIDGAILSPASVLAQNLIPIAWSKQVGHVTVNRLAVLLVALCSLVTAYSGASAMELLEAAYSLMLVGLLVPLVGGLWLRRRPPIAAIAAMIVGTAVWLPHLFLEDSEWLAQPWLVPRGIYLPMNITATICSGLAFLFVGQNLPEAVELNSETSDATS
ncbi:MAG: sodium:solute symporter family protein [Planctomycetaceae bacterium]|nr:sodium:solute symporter family protein [Planctomycetaceae bacterium]